MQIPARLVISLLLLACSLCVRSIAEEPTETQSEAEYLSVNLHPDRVCFISTDGAVTVVAQNTGIRRVSADGCGYVFNRLQAGKLETCQLVPGQVADQARLNVAYESPEWRDSHLFDFDAFPRDGSLALLYLPHALDPHRDVQRIPNLYLLERKSRVLVPLTHFVSEVGGGPMRPRWSPKGNNIAFYLMPDSSACDPHGARLALYVVSREGQVRKLADESITKSAGGGADPYPGPIWSHDGQQVFFVGHFADEPAEFPPGYPITYAADLSDGQVLRIGPGNPYSVTPDGRYLFCSAPFSPDGPSRALSRRVDLRTGEFADLGAAMQRIRVSPSGRYLASFPGHTIIIFTIDGEEKARIDMDQHELLKPGTGIVSWVAFK